MTVLAFLNKRRSFKKDVWGGRPGLVMYVLIKILTQKKRSIHRRPDILHSKQHSTM